MRGDTQTSHNGCSQPSALTEFGAQRAAVEIARLLATGQSSATVRDRILVDVTGLDFTSPLGIDGLLEITVAAADLFRQVLNVYATEPGTDLLAALDAFAAVLATEP